MCLSDVCRIGGCVCTRTMTLTVGTCHKNDIYPFCLPILVSILTHRFPSTAWAITSVTSCINTQHNVYCMFRNNVFPSTNSVSYLLPNTWHIYCRKTSCYFHFYRFSSFLPKLSETKSFCTFSPYARWCFRNVYYFCNVKVKVCP
jgi:hypothetical protein